MRRSEAPRTRHRNTACRPGVIAALLALAPASGMAHYPWIMPESFQSAADQPLRFVVGWGHEFPGDGELPGERLEEAAQWSHGGEKEALKVLPGGAQKAIPAPATTQLTVNQIPSYFSRTREGGKRASREAYPDAMSCSKSHNAAKALITSERGRTGAMEPVGLALEIIPLENPAEVTPGESLPVQALWFGQSQPGPWLLHVQNTTSYADDSICDVKTFNSTVTFEVSQ